MKEILIAAIDQGTTSSRCILFNCAGQVVSADQKEHTQIYPAPGWVEHDPLEILQNTLQVFRGALNRMDISERQIGAIGITNQRETTVLWDRRTGLPVHNAIVWQDTRTRAICQELETVYGPRGFQQRTGLPLATYFSGPKIMWLLREIPGLRRMAEEGDLLFGTMDTWLIWNLTGGPQGGRHVTDVTNASRTLLMNLVSLQWDPDLLATLEIPAGMLPEIAPSSGSFGATAAFGKSIAITGALGDQQAALFGQTCFQPGEAKNTYGTGCFMLMNTGSTVVGSPNGLLTTVAYQVGRKSPAYALEGSIAVAGSLVQWLRDNLGLIRASAEVEQLARRVEDNGGIYFVPAFSGLFAPYWRSDARGAIVGLTAFANAGHLARAALEATAYQTREVLDAMEKDSGVRLASLKVDGGMVANELLMQFQADLLGVPVQRPRVAETTALGAAYAAGLACGYWTDEEALCANWQLEKAWHPHMPAERRAALYAGWKKAVERTFGWAE